jgi:hypothetical protein
MSIFKDVYFVGSMLLGLGIIMTTLLFPGMAVAEIPPIDAVDVEHTETATFALG